VRRSTRRLPHAPATVAANPLDNNIGLAEFIASRTGGRRPSQLGCHPEQDHRGVAGEIVDTLARTGEGEAGADHEPASGLDVLRASIAHVGGLFHL
jgi:hypothetical protein